MTNSNLTWTSNAKSLATALHAELSITHENWHKLKTNHSLRSSELISGALVQLIKGGNPSDVEELLEQAIKWLKKEIKDPGCPHH